MSLASTEFIFDGKYSAEMGLMIASLESDSFSESTPLTYAVRTSKTTRGDVFTFEGLELDEPPVFQFDVFSRDGSELSDIDLREIYKWLIGRNEFKELRFLIGGYENYTYRCVFKEINKRYHLNRCVGLMLTAVFDSNYCYGKREIFSITSDGTKFEELKIPNNSDLIDECVYPTVTFTPQGSFSDGIDEAGNEIQKSIIIKNEKFIYDSSAGYWHSDESFEFIGINHGETIFTDGQTMMVRILDPSTQTYVPGDRLVNFNKKFLRLKSGLNELKIKINGTVEIAFVPKIRIGF